MARCRLWYVYLAAFLGMSLLFSVAYALAFFRNLPANSKWGFSVFTGTITSGTITGLIFFIRSPEETEIALLPGSYA